MFRLTSNIYIGPFKAIKANSINWTSSIDNFSDNAKLKLPAIAMLKRQGDVYERVQTGLQFSEGMKVKIYAGYDGNNELQFDGFIRRINFTIPLEIECEGYSYQLRKNIDFTKSYKNTTVKKILEDLVQDTDIELSADIPDIPIPKALFKNATGIQVIEWLKEKCLLSVYFSFNELYAGGLALSPGITKKLRLGYNILKDNELKFSSDKEFADVRISISARNEQGEIEKAFAGPREGNIKQLNSPIRDQKTKEDIAEQKRRELVNNGYEGSITTFLYPYVKPGMSVEIDDTRYPDRQGKYFVTSVDGSFTRSGGRQKIKIGFSL